ncbi:hypothetical protein MPSEU_000447400 [Mayamaea pseudoterrestris]|nr:hypothetical protein MPSEU_000447400 [Mayamaea pseudoterrestris]
MWQGARSLWGNCGSTGEESSLTGTLRDEMDDLPITPAADDEPRLRVPASFQIDYLELNREKDESKPLMNRLAKLKKMFQRKSPNKKMSADLKKRAQSAKPLGSISIDTAANSSVLSSLLNPKPALAMPVIPVRTSIPDPQTHLNAILTSRGYATTVYSTLDTAYYATPSPFQEASYSAHLIHLVRTNNVSALERILSSGTISRNPCNAYGESLVHTVCRRGYAQLLKVMLHAGTRVQVCDDYGRTPLHDACWTPEPCFALIELLLEHDPFLVHMIDMRGSTALSYVQRSSWAAWRDFLDTNKDKFWPIGFGHAQKVPELVSEEPNSRPLSEPDGNLEVAAMVAMGKLTPEEALIILQDGCMSIIQEDEMEDDETDSDDEDDEEEEEEEDDDEGAEDDESWGVDEELVTMVENYMRFV